MKVVYYCNDNQCEKCRKVFDSYKDLYCPNCPRPAYSKPPAKPYAEMSLHEKSLYLYAEYIRCRHNKIKHKIKKGIKNES
jgi:hypothetical protein